MAPARAEIRSDDSVGFKDRGAFKRRDWTRIQPGLFCVSPSTIATKDEK